MESSSIDGSSETDDDLDHERIGPQNIFFDGADDASGKDFEVIEEIRRIRTLATDPDTAASLPLEKSLRSRPRILLFKDFRAGKSYQRRLSIVNQSTSTICLRYRGIVCHDDVSQILSTELKMETLDVARIKPGLQILIRVEFSPRQSTSRGKENNASLVFTTWSFEDAKKRGADVERREFRIPVRCLPGDQPHSDISKTTRT